MQFAGRFLVKTVAPAPVGMGAAASPEFPLFTTALAVGAAGPTASADWVVAPLKTAAGITQNGWDMAHALLASKQEVAGVPIQLIEPDFRTPFPFSRTDVSQVGIAAAAAGGDSCKQDQPNTAWPFGGFAWHLGANFSQLLDARLAAGAPAGMKIRVVHLDTGYSPGHQALPQYLRPDLARNFVEPDNPFSAIDPGTSGLMKNPGHGTGTMSILAGNRFAQAGFNDFLGGAPNAEIIPVRIGDSVVHFYSSSMAQGLDYALAVGAQVVSISMGGVPSKAWAEAVNRAYEAGIAIFAASGNNIGGFPTTSTVYPARFNRVTAVCGAAGDRTPYYKGLLYPGMQGNFGPAAKMKTAMAAFTPNIPWAEWGCPGTVDLDGAGTSAATPQCAAAAALWFQQHSAALQAPAFATEPWRRVEAVRKALFSTADKSPNKSDTYFGNGILRANDALAVLPDPTLSKTAEDSVSWPWLRLLFGVGAAPSPRQEMLVLETIQLLSAFDELAGDERELMHEGAQPTNAEIKAIMDRLEKSPRASVTLREEIQNLGL